MQLLTFGQALRALPMIHELSSKDRVWQGEEATLWPPYTQYWGLSQVYFLRAPPRRFSLFMLQRSAAETWDQNQKGVCACRWNAWVHRGCPHHHGSALSHFRGKVLSEGVDHHSRLSTCCGQDAVCHTSAALPLWCCIHCSRGDGILPMPIFQPTGVEQCVQSERDAPGRLWLVCSFCSYPPGRLVSSLASIAPLFFMSVVSP